MTCATVTASGPSLRTVSAIVPGLSFVRSKESSSTGGPRRSPRPGPSRAMNEPIASAISSSGTTASSQPGTRRVAPVSRSAVGLPASMGQSVTSKNPIQPSSVNSDWWAWNMYLPV